MICRTSQGGIYQQICFRMVSVGQEDLGTKDADLRMTCVCVAWLVSRMSSVRDQEEDMLAAAVDQYLEQRFLEAF